MVAEKDREDADPLFCFVHVEPVDGPVDCQMSQARRRIVVTLTALRRRTQLVGARADIADAVLAMIQCGFNERPEAAVTLKQLVEDQGEITLGLRRNLNPEPHGRGAFR